MKIHHQKRELCGKIFFKGKSSDERKPLESQTKERNGWKIANIRNETFELELLSPLAVQTMTLSIAKASRDVDPHYNSQFYVFTEFFCLMCRAHTKLRRELQIQNARRCAMIQFSRKSFQLKLEWALTTTRISSSRSLKLPNQAHSVLPWNSTNQPKRNAHRVIFFSWNFSFIIIAFQL